MADSRRLMRGPAVPPKNSPYPSTPASSILQQRPSVRHRKSAYELDRGSLGRQQTTKSSTTNSSSATNSSTQTAMTSRSLMSGYSAGGFSATSAGSLARKNKVGSLKQVRPLTSSGVRASDPRPQTPLTGVSYHSGHESHNIAQQRPQSSFGWNERPASSGGLGGFSTPKHKKQGFFKKLIEGAKTGAASARSIAGSDSRSQASSPIKQRFIGAAGGTADPSTTYGRDAAQEMGLGGANMDYLSARRDVNRSTTPSHNERRERAERCQMLDHPAICPLEELYQTAQGNESGDGGIVVDPMQLSNPSFTLVDKSARFITSLPPTITSTSLAQAYVCRPHRSVTQRLRAIFTWCSERIAWDEPFEGQIDSRHTIQSRRGCAQEVAFLVAEMCAAISVPAEVVHGHLKTPGGDLDLDGHLRPNHFWNAILVDNEWRIMDCSLASPTNPKRPLYSTVSSSIADPFYFLAQPLEACYTHTPSENYQQHIAPPVSPDTLLALPCALPPYFRLSVQLHNYDTSLLRLEGLELATFQVNVAPDVEIAAEIECKSYLRDGDGDLYESDGTLKKRALAQASWHQYPNQRLILQKRYTIKAVLPTGESFGTLKIYAGKKGLMHNSKDIPHALALALPIYHQGTNPAYDFLIKHPTPHAQRQDLYAISPQCHALVVGETFVFAVRQHTASIMGTPQIEQNSFDFSARPVSPAINGNGIVRPSSAMSMMSMMSMTQSQAGSQASDQAQGLANGNGLKQKDKPAKLAVQSPGGKIIRLHRRPDEMRSTARIEVDGVVQGSVWETSVKVQERGTWRGLVLADRSARWCVWGEWEGV